MYHAAVSAGQFRYHTLEESVMVPAIVPVYAAVLALIYIVLSARVIQARRSAK